MGFPSKAFIPQGLTVQVDNPAGSGAGFETIAEIRKTGFSGGKVDTPDVTNMDSQGGHREFIAGLIESGEFNFDGNYLGNADQTQMDLNSILESRVLANWKIVLPPGPGETQSRGAWSFAGLVTQFDPDFPTDKEASFSCKIKISGPRTFTP